MLIKVWFVNAENSISELEFEFEVSITSGNFDTIIEHLIEKVNLECKCENSLKKTEFLSFKYRENGLIESDGVYYDKNSQKSISLIDKSLITFRLSGDRIKDLSNSSAEEINKKGNSLIKEGKYSEAISEYIKATGVTKNDEDKAKYFHNKGISLSRQSRHKEAIEEYIKAIELSKDDERKSKYLNSKGHALFNQGNYAEAIIEYTKAIETTKNHEIKITYQNNLKDALSKQTVNGNNEEEARAKAEREAKLKAEQEARAKAEREAKLKAEQEARAKAEREAKLKAEQGEARAKAERATEGTPILPSYNNYSDQRDQKNNQSNDLELESATFIKKKHKLDLPF